MADKEFRVIVTVETTSALDDDARNWAVDTYTKSFPESTPLREIVDWVSRHKGYATHIKASITLDGYDWDMPRTHL